MRNPFTSLPKKKPETRYYVKTYRHATPIIAAVNIYSGLASAILTFAIDEMNVKNECEANLQDLDSALGIKNAATRTKALNVLRLMNLIETSTCNRTGMTKFRINSKAYSTETEVSALKSSSFHEDLNFDALDENGFIKDEAIKNFKARKPTTKKDKVDKDGIPF